MLNWLIRYQPALQHATRERSKRVLDVGSGWHGLSWYWSGHVVQTDLNFRAETRPSESARVGAASFVAASVVELPFADNSFDLVVCLDMLEHLSSELRARAVDELLRVGSTVLLAFPSDKIAEQTDRLTAKLLHLMTTPIPRWLTEHQQCQPYPTVAEVLSGLSGDVVAVRSKNLNRWAQLLLMAAEHHHRLAWLPASLENRYRESPRWQLLHLGRTYREVLLLSRGAADVLAIPQ